MVPATWLMPAGLATNVHTAGVLAGVTFPVQAAVCSFIRVYGFVMIFVLPLFLFSGTCSASESGSVGQGNEKESLAPRLTLPVQTQMMAGISRRCPCAAVCNSIWT